MKRNNTQERKINAITLTNYVFKTYYALSFVFVLAVFFYLYFLFGSIYSTAVRKDLQIKISKTNSEIADMEASYMKDYENINPSSDFAQKFVAINPKAKIFAKRQRLLGRAR